MRLENMHAYIHTYVSLSLSLTHTHSCPMGDVTREASGYGGKTGFLLGKQNYSGKRLM